MQKTNKDKLEKGNIAQPLDKQGHDSIIDVTDQVQSLNPAIQLRRFRSEIPYWPNQEIYSQNDIDSQTDAHITFYRIFKSCFLKKDFIDLKGNTNYAYTLLFELLDEFEDHLDLSLLRTQIETLILCYPETKHDALDYLSEILYEHEKEEDDDYFYFDDDEEEEDDEEKKISYSIRLQTEEIPKGSIFVYYKRNDFHVTLRNLSNYEYHLLNVIELPRNAFIKINLCWAEVCKLYIHTIHALHSFYTSEGTSFDKVLDHVADLIAVKHYKHIKKGGSYFNCINYVKKQIYQRIFSYCEIKVREVYGYNSSFPHDYVYTDEEIASALNTQIHEKVNQILPEIEGIISEPNVETERILNTTNKNRWKIKLSKLKADYHNNPSEFTSSVIQIAQNNVNNKKINNLFYEASKFIANHDRLSALTLYLYGINEEAKLYSVNYKQLTKALQKILFDTKAQQQEFERIASELLHQKDLVFAISSVSRLYEQKRKKITLDIHTIKEVQQQHSGTVELLNQYLQDDSEEGKVNIAKPETEMHVPVVSSEPPSHTFLSEISLKPDQVSILELFQKSGFSLSQNEVEAFAKSRRIFINQLIEGINEACYEVLDDVLIEQNEASFTILPEYFNKIST